MKEVAVATYAVQFTKQAVANSILAATDSE